MFHSSKIHFVIFCYLKLSNWIHIYLFETENYYSIVYEFVFNFLMNFKLLFSNSIFASHTKTIKFLFNPCIRARTLPFNINNRINSLTYYIWLTVKRRNDYFYWSRALQFELSIDNFIAFIVVLHTLNKTTIREKIISK